MGREQMEAAGYGVHHRSDDGKYLIMGNGKRAFAIAAEQPENYLKADRTDNVPDNEKLAEKKAVIEQRDKAGKDVLEKKTEKKSGREI
jgi:2,3-bisphosphoglycerate-independent phosphoglycerate mutase